MKVATTIWLKERLNLEISEEKSKITNVKVNYTEFLGFKIKATWKPNKRKYTVRSHMSDKALNSAIEKLKNALKTIQKKSDGSTANAYNAKVVGLHGYYNKATHCSTDFAKISYLCSKTLKNRLKQKANIIKANESKNISSKTYNKLYGKYNFKKYSVANIVLFPIGGISMTYATGYSQEVTPYTEHGRIKIHDTLSKKYNTDFMRFLLYNPVYTQSTEFNDNRISLYVAQYGKCAITGFEITKLDHVHHIKGRNINKPDQYKNLVYIKKDVHTLIHATDSKTISRYMIKLELNKLVLDKVNEFRIKFGNVAISQV